MWPFRSRKNWKLSHELLKISKSDGFTVADAFEGALILGATGSGKSSGSGRTLALAYLKAGFGGLVLTAKPDERAVWESYCRKAGRRRDLRIFSPAHKLRFNFLDYELNRKGAGAGLTDNLVGMFSEILQIAERTDSSGGRDNEGYWRRTNRQLCRNAVDLLVFAKGTLSIPDLYRLVVSAPTSLEQANSSSWQKSSFCFECLAEADGRLTTARQEHDFGIVADFFLLEFPGLSEKTRSIVVSTFTSMIDVLNRGVLAELFCTSTNITPEAAERGAIVLIDLNIKEFRESGLFAQVLWKIAFQRAMERRNLRRSPRPVFLWADEAQCFVTSPNDMQFQTTCRAAGVATVFLSQNVSNFYAALGGGDGGRAEADSIFANLNTKILHANGDPVTNEWAATLIGRSRQFLINASSSNQPVETDWFSGLMGWGGKQANCGMSEHIDYEVQPRAFTALRRGGKKNRWRVEGIVFQGGRLFRKTGRTWLPVTFDQRI
jgi:type IV secretory pathway TraG/TraD family ATPase VirD4